MTSRPGQVLVVGPRDCPYGAPTRGFAPPPGTVVVNTTSQSADDWSTGLSPFVLGPVPLYDGRTAVNVENAWQFAKVYPHHTEPMGGPPGPRYWAWAERGWADARAHRYPMGRGAKPLYSWWDGERLGYVAARRRIYVPLYARAVIDTAAYARLAALYVTCERLVLWDFDGYDHRASGATYADVLHNPTKTMGHAFVLAMLLERTLLWNPHRTALWMRL